MIQFSSAELQNLCLSSHSGLDYSDYIAISASIIAFMSLATLFVQTFFIYKHNKKIVRPILDVTNHHIPSQPFKCVLHNSGLGPAIIEEMYLLVDSKKFEMSEDAFHTAFLKVGLDLKNLPHTCASVTKGTTLIAGAEMTIMQIDVGNKFDHAKLVYPRMKLEIIYKSIYDEKFKVVLPI